MGEKKKKAIPHILFQKSEDVPTSLHKGSIILVPNGTNALRKNCGQHPSWTQMQNSLQNFSKPNQLDIKRTRYYDKRSSSQERSMVQHLENQRYSPLSMDRKEKPHHHHKDEGKASDKIHHPFRGSSAFWEWKKTAPTWWCPQRTQR